MKHFACAHLVADDPTTFVADSDEKLLLKVAIHVRKEHGMLVTRSLIETVKQNIVDIDEVMPKPSAARRYA